MKTRLFIIAVVAAAIFIADLLVRKDRDPATVDLDPPVESTDTEFSGLNEAKEKFIWDAEHFTFGLETYVGKPLSAALKNRNSSKVPTYFTKDFQGTRLTETSREWFAVGGTSTEIRTQPEQSTTNAGVFSEWLAGRLPESTTIHKVKMRVLKIARESDSHDQWKLTCLLTMSGTDESDQQVFLKQDSTVLCRFETSDDIQVGQIIRQWIIEREEIRRSPQLLVETTKKAGLDVIELHDNWTASNARQYNKQVAVADYDNNGYPDIALADNDRRIRLLKNEAGRFTDVTSKMGLPTQLTNSVVSNLVTWIDFDNDADADLLVDDQLFENDGGTFRAVENCNLKLNYRPMGSAVADFDCDGLVDIYVLYQIRKDAPSSRSAGWVGDDSAGAPNQLWKNLGNGRFKNVTATAKVAGGWRHSFAATWLHANDDMYPDLYVANDFAKNSFFLNQGDGTFKDISDSSGTADFATSMGVTAGDLDGDGESEIYVSNMYSKMGRRILAQVEQSDYPTGIYEQLLGACAGNRLYRKSADGESYTDFSHQLGVNAVGWAYAPAFSDFNRDGWLDIYATAGFLSFERGKPDG